MGHDGSSSFRCLGTSAERTSFATSPRWRRRPPSLEVEADCKATAEALGSRVIQLFSLPWSNPDQRTGPTGEPAPPLALRRSSSAAHSGPWSQRWDSNPRPPDYKSGALPTELRWRVTPPRNPLEDLVARRARGPQTPRSRIGSAVWYGRARLRQGSSHQSFAFLLLFWPWLITRPRQSLPPGPCGRETLAHFASSSASRKR